ncbi:hypothetical protein KUTeg_019444 [Tegillarca granosa]|uniref:RNA helicase n=1 Tax=Tegillarca granosa TaxID=220873 RepID=A0ABQ9ECI5_TEGGR|nr:hypothetical protein KUTeg_019444 [Tegillarca granosa]
METEDDFIRTIDENEDIDVAEESPDSDEEVVAKKTKTAKKSTTEFNSNFSFNDQFNSHSDFDPDFALKYAKRKQESTSLDEKIAKVRKKKKKGKKGKRRKRGQDSDEEEKEKIEFSETIDTFDDQLTFQDMNVSRPLMKGLSSMNFEKPTPIQAATIPVALLGKDICACAVTGSGKTVAFMLPILERLLYRPKQAAVTRVLVLVPTRELAVQVHTVSRQLAHHTNIEIQLSAGGLDLKAQEAALRRGPDVVIATPGRLIDHLHNSPNFNLNNIEILVLDEADRMLDEYFAEQMKEVIRLCSRNRQTMLFSATMTDEIERLNTDVALGLRQEFIRIRPNREGDREAIIGALVSRTFRDHCIVFIQTKKQAHRMHIILGLLGINVGELHGNLSQAQRLDALKKFKDSEIDVINFTMPNTIKHYVHRVGRTARAGRKGRSVTLVGEQERKLLKEVVKKARTPLKTRIVPQEVIVKYKDKIANMAQDILEIEKEEKEESVMRATENQLNKAKNLLENQKEMMNRQKRTWFQSHKERMKEKASLRLADHSALSGNKKKQDKGKKKSLTADDRALHEINKSQEYAARFSKKSFKAKRLRVFNEEDATDHLIMNARKWGYQERDLTLRAIRKEKRDDTDNIRILIKRFNQVKICKRQAEDNTEI